MAAARDLTWDQLLEIVLHPKALKDTCHCIQHDKECPFPVADLHAAGCPCTDWSNYGTKLGTEGKKNGSCVRHLVGAQAEVP